MKTVSRKEVCKDFCHLPAFMVRSLSDYDRVLFCDPSFVIDSSDDIRDPYLGTHDRGVSI